VKYGLLHHHPTGYGRIFDYGENVLDWVDVLIHYLSPPPLKDLDYWPQLPEGFRYFAMENPLAESAKKEATSLSCIEHVASVFLHTCVLTGI
jgi:hypothetical protein